MFPGISGGVKKICSCKKSVTFLEHHNKKKNNQIDSIINFLTKHHVISALYKKNHPTEARPGLNWQQNCIK